jgi:hypothetical protein
MLPIVAASPDRDSGGLAGSGSASSKAYSEVVTLTAYGHPGPPEDEGSWATATTQAVPKIGTCVGELYRGPLGEPPLPGPDASEA